MKDGVNKTLQLAKNDVMLVNSVLIRSGFSINLNKCILEPTISK